MAEVLHGNASNNQLNAAENRTQVYGLSGNDTLTSDGKSEVLLVGGSGDDRLIMAGGNGTLAGGAGADTFELNYSATKSLSAVIEDLNPSEDKIVVNFAGTSTPQLTTVTSGNNVILRDGGGNFNVTLKGVRDNDYFDGTISDEAWEILKLTNDEREAKGLSALTMSDGLTDAAQIRVQEITELDEQKILDIYKHTRPGGASYATVFDEVGKHYSAYAENITAGESTAAEAMHDWIVSDSHNVNIWNPNYLKLGVGYNHLNIGSHSASQLDYWEQLFGGSLRQTEMETVSTADLLTTNPEVHTISTAVTLTENPDTYSNSVFGATIAALGGNDSITNTGLLASISGGADNDTIDNRGSFATINAGTGNDSISLNANEVLIQFAAGDGSDTISGLNSSETLSISGGEYMPVTVGNDVVVGVGADSITLTGAARSNVQIVGTRSKLYLGTEDDDTIKADVNGATIQALGGNDSITNDGGANVLFIHESGDDTIGGFNSTSTLQIAGGSYDSFASGNDLILRSGAELIKILRAGGLSSINISDANGNPVTVGNAKDIRGTEQADNLSNDLDGATIRAFGGDDTITNSGATVSIDAGAGNDSISNNGSQVSIFGGAGNDSVNNNGQPLTTYIYESGDDTIEGFNDSDTLNIGGYSYSTVQSENDIIVNIDTGSITLKDYSGQDVNIVSSYVPPTVPGEEISNSAADVSVVGTAGDDTITNYSGSNVTITALAGNDSVDNHGNSALVEGGVGNDTLYNYVSAGTDDANYSTVRGGDGDDFIDNHGNHALIDGGAGNDTIYNYAGAWRDDEAEYSTLLGGSGNDVIDNVGNNVSINTGAGDDSIYNYGDIATIIGGDGADTISNDGANASIDGGAGDDSIQNFYGTNVTIDGGTGDDYIYNGDDVLYGYGANALINGGAGDDYIHNEGDSVSIDDGAGDDYIRNEGDSVTINTGIGDDSIFNIGDSVSINSGDGNDEITNGNNISGYPRYGFNVTINAGSGEDTITNYGTNVTILGGTGDDQISLSSSSRNNFIRYADGDDNDTVWGITENDTLNLLADETLTSSIVSGNDLIINVGAGSILLIGARNKPPKITYGESGTEGGGSNSGGNSGGNNSSSGGGDRGGNDGGNTSGGTSGKEGMTSDFSGGRSAVGSRGRSSSTNTDTSGGTVRATSSRSGKKTASAMNLGKLMSALTPATQPTTNQRIYNGGNMAVSDYQSGEKIIFNEIYTGSFYDEAGNYFVGSSTGALVIQNAPDKVIDLQDTAGNSFLKAYAATTAGVIDGRGLGGFEVINGSAGADAIFAGDDGSQLWGGADVASDVLIGGGGTDIFIVSKYQGSDFIGNASSADIVHLIDASLSDIVATAEDNGAIAVAFNTGNVVGVQSSEALSATFMLADGSAYRYNHMTKNWQNA